MAIASPAERGAPVHRILAARYPGETQVALLRDGVLREYYIDRAAEPDGIGDLVMARVVAVVPAMAGAFVELPAAEGFLPDTEGGAGLTAGSWVVVRVTRAAQGGKGPRVAAAANDIVMPPGGPVRLLRPGPSALDELRDAYPAAAVETEPWPEALLDEIEALAAPGFDLPGGLRGTATPTPALTAIDLDGGRSTGARGAKAGAQLAANLNAVPELARQIALRNFSGAVLIDFAGVPARKRVALGPALEPALAADRLRPRLAGFSALGFAEIVRPRRRPPLHDKLLGPLAAGLAALRRIAAEAHATPAQPLALRAAPPVIEALQADSAALAELARVTTHPLIWRPDPSLTGTSWMIETNRA